MHDAGFPRSRHWGSALPSHKLDLLPISYLFLSFARRWYSSSCTDRCAHIESLTGHEPGIRYPSSCVQRISRKYSSRANAFMQGIYTISRWRAVQTLHGYDRHQELGSSKRCRRHCAPKDANGGSISYCICGCVDIMRIRCLGKRANALNKVNEGYLLLVACAMVVEVTNVGLNGGVYEG